MDKITHIDEYIKKKDEQAKSYKIGRNEPCPCGSGKKYKKCCAQVTPERSKKYYQEKIKEEKDAKKIYELLLEADSDYPIDPDFTIPIAVYSLQNKKSDLARKYLYKAWRIMGADLDDVFIMPLVNLLLQQGNVEEASDIVDKALAEKGDSPQLLISQGEVMKAKGNFEEVFELIEKGLEIEHNNLELVIFKIETLLDINNLVAALEVWYNRFDRLMPLVETDEVYSLRFLKQLLVENFSMPEDAEKEEMKAVLEQAIEANQLWNEVYKNISDQKIKEARGKLDKINELLPADSALVTNLLNDYYIAGSYDRIIEIAQASAKHFSDNPDFNHIWGLAFLEKGRLDEAEPKLDIAHEMAHGPKVETQIDEWSITGSYIRLFLEKEDKEGLMELIEDVDGLLSEDSPLISSLLSCLDSYRIEKFPMQLLMILKDKTDHPLIKVDELYISYVNILLKMLKKAEKKTPDAVDEMKNYLKDELEDLNLSKFSSSVIELALLRAEEDDLTEDEIEEKYEKLLDLASEFPEDSAAKCEAIIRYGNSERLLNNPPEDVEMIEDKYIFYSLIAAFKTEKIKMAEELFKEVGYTEIRKGNSSSLFLELLDYVESEKLIKVMKEFENGDQFIPLIKELVSYLNE